MEAWHKFINQELLDNALAAIEGVDIVPPRHMIFDAMRYCNPETVSTVIIGQDPYPTPGDAHGLSFSVSRGRSIPESLKRIFGCLERANLRRALPGAECGDL